ncbi:MAG: hypothetical protein ABEJ70_04670 [Halobacteriaceae archaeon]
MRLRNREGRAVDPVPFLVVASLALAVCVAFGPLYVMALGFSPVVAVSASAGGFVATTAGAFYRLVWTAFPERRAEVPVEYRLRRLFVTALAAVAALVLLSLPFLARI